MTITLDPPALRRVAHKLLDELLDKVGDVLLDIAISLVDPDGAEESARADAVHLTKTPVQPTEKPHRVKPAPLPPQKSREVTVACRRSCGHLEIAVSFSVQVAERLGLKARSKATLDLHAGKLRVRASKGGRPVYGVHADSTRLFFTTVARNFAVTEKHKAEGCVFQYDLEDALLIDPPAWLKKGAAAVPSAERAGQKPKHAAPVSCKKMAGTNPAIKCHACKKATATVECSRCPTLLCDGCWEAHVRTHWHTAVTSRPPTGCAPVEKGARP